MLLLETLFLNRNIMMVKPALVKSCQFREHLGLKENFLPFHCLVNVQRKAFKIFLRPD